MRLYSFYDTGFGNGMLQLGHTDEEKGVTTGVWRFLDTRAGVLGVRAYY